MPSDSNETKRARRKINPATATVEELCKYFATDPSVGLSPKEAERRLENSTAAPLFRTAPRSFWQCLGQTVKEPVLWLLLVVGIISLFFDRVVMGLSCVFLTAGNAALCAYLLYRTDRLEAAMLSYDVPLARVLRNRRVTRVSAEGLVRGDVILLRKGDIVPADCRLLRTEGFAVSERELDATDPHRPTVRLEKDADAAPSTGGQRLSPENMAYAGGIVEDGFAIALVVAVGSKTHVGGLCGTIPSGRRGRVPTLFTKSTKYLSWYNLALVGLILPITAIGIFTLSANYDLLDLFLSALALASVTLTEHLLAKGIYVAAATRRAAAVDRDAEGTAEIKTSLDHEKLTAMTDLFLVGTAALHDGRVHPELVYIGQNEYRCDTPDADNAARAVAECVYLYGHGMRQFPEIIPSTRDMERIISPLCEWAELDTEATILKIKEIRTEEDGVSGIFPTVEGNHRVTVTLTHDVGEAQSCDLYDTGVRALPMSDGGREEMDRVHGDLLSQGYSILFVITRTDGMRTVRAMIAYAPAVSRKTAGFIKSFEKAGIRVSAFLHDVSDTHARTLTACGITSGEGGLRPNPDGSRTRASLLIADGHRAFEGCSTGYVEDAIKALQAEGRVVGVLSAEAEDIPLLAAADIAFTCAPSLYTSADEDGFAHLTEQEDSDLPDGSPEGSMANDHSRRLADVIVRRTTVSGGGIAGVRRALLAADACKNALDRALRFTLISQVIRIVMAVFPLILGLAPAAAPALLLSGLLVDLVVLLVAIYLPLGHEPAPRRRLDEGLTSPWATWRNDLIAAVIGSVIPWIAAGVCYLCGVSFGGNLVYFGALCIVAIQLACFRLERLPRKNRTAFLGTLAMVLLYIGIFAAALGTAQEVKSFLWWTLPLPPVVAMLYVGLRTLLTRVINPTAQG